jgi:hypothetical protein
MCTASDLGVVTRFFLEVNRFRVDVPVVIHDYNLVTSHAMNVTQLLASVELFFKQYHKNPVSIGARVCELPVTIYVLFENLLAKNTIITLLLQSMMSIPAAVYVAGRVTVGTCLQALSPSHSLSFCFSC